MCDAKGQHLHYLPIILGEDEEPEYLTVNENGTEVVRTVYERALEDVEQLPDGVWKENVLTLVRMWHEVMIMNERMNGEKVDDTDESMLTTTPHALAMIIQKFSMNATSRGMRLPMVM